jgi:hypothetical protein
MHHSAYKPIRMEMCTWPNNLYLKTLTAISARRARLEANKYPNKQWEYEFNDLCNQYLEIRDLSYTNISSLAAKYYLSKFAVNMRWMLKRIRSN